MVCISNIVVQNKGYAFRDEKGETFRAVVVPAPYQKIVDGPEPVDELANTIESGIFFHTKSEQTKSKQKSQE